MAARNFVGFPGSAFAYFWAKSCGVVQGISGGLSGSHFDRTAKPSDAVRGASSPPSAWAGRRCSVLASLFGRLRDPAEIGPKSTSLITWRSKSKPRSL